MEKTKHDGTELAELPIQFGQSVTIDESAKVWAFAMEDDFVWSGGRFAIVPIEVHEKTHQALKNVLSIMLRMIGIEVPENPTDDFFDEQVEKLKKSGVL